LLPGLDFFLQQRLGIPVRVASDPQRTVVRGAAICAEHLHRWRNALEADAA
jgi:rod shape-determining protein MreB